MERKRRKEMEKEALENARLEGGREHRAAWRDELDSGEEDDERRRDRGSSRRREGREDRERERERGRGHSDRESRHRNIRSHRSSKSRSRSPHRVCYMYFCMLDFFFFLNLGKENCQLRDIVP